MIWESIRPAVPDGHANKYIVGELYRINYPEEFDWAMAQLDDYRGIEYRKQ